MTEDYTQTLNDLIQLRANEWGEQDLLKIAEGFRSQCERWNAEQALGSRKLVKSTSIPVTKKKLNIQGIKLKI